MSTTSLSAPITLEYLTMRNNESVDLSEIPTHNYPEFCRIAIDLMKSPANHCVNYYAFPHLGKLKFICCIADDNRGTVRVFSFESFEPKPALSSLSRQILPFQIFEREIAENFGVHFEGHPWMKPVRYAFNRADKGQILQNYPFYRIGGEEIHEVGVGPIHAGVIEPGHFRFLCNGETVLHLEIQLGYQHRGVENLFLTKKKLIQRTVLAESIAGDTAIGHNLAFVQNMETLAGIQLPEALQLLRSLALELERIAIHVGDLSAFCLDVAYQLGSAVFGALRTPAINYTQLWCGNRFGKGLLRVGYNPYAFTTELKTKLLDFLRDFEFKVTEIGVEMFDLPTVQARYEHTGDVTREQMELIGAVGMSARITGIKRDIRNSHPFAYYKNQPYEPVLQETGDVWARGMLRYLEIQQSIAYIRGLVARIDEVPATPRVPDVILKPNQFSLSMTEGWRGEICHCAITDETGELAHYKVKDPSLHNWLALALAVRDQEISDFPICNKSYDLSYCGNDL